jgi:uncharacterized membrane protein AbrB (regulator of aidB expression)
MKYEEVRLVDPPRQEGILLVPSVPQPREAHTGWTVFAGALMLLAGLVNIVWGFFEILNDYYFTGDTVASSSHSLWGWLYILIGVFLLMVGPLVFLRNPAGLFFGALALGASVVTHALGLGSRPAWSIVAIAISVVALYGLITYGAKVQEPRRRR